MQKSINYNGKGDIEEIKLTEVRIKKHGLGNIRITISSFDVRSLFERFSLNEEGTEFLYTKLKFAIREEGERRKEITIEIKPPETKKIKERREKQIIEDYLREEGVLLV